MKWYGKYGRKVSWICEMIWKIWQKSRLKKMWNDMENMEERQVNSDKIVENMEEKYLNSEMIWKIWKKGRLNSEKIWENMEEK